jgi:hypothetical protein
MNSRINGIKQEKQQSLLNCTQPVNAIIRTTHKYLVSIPSKFFLIELNKTLILKVEEESEMGFLNFRRLLSKDWQNYQNVK